MKVQRYSSEKKTEWDEFVKQSRNATFLFYRDFMDYHSNRFQDCSLMLYNKKRKLIAIFPASKHKEIDSIKSHGGLTYGGLLLDKRLGTKDILLLFQLIVNQYAEMGFHKLYIKPIPQIYHLSPSQEELYALFTHSAILKGRNASSTIHFSQPLSFSTLRLRQARKSQKMGCTIDWDGNLEDFWQVLTASLRENHGVAPVHSLPEISLLKERFPDNIKCVTVLDSSRNMVGGTLLFCTPQTIHTQYIAANCLGKAIGALDLLFIHLIERYKADYEVFKSPLYFDFGISTENDGHYLNEGLIAQKEGFGAHTTIYDEYVIDLT